jgi:hypothetical protein
VAFGLPGLGLGLGLEVAFFLWSGAGVEVVRAERVPTKSFFRVTTPFRERGTGAVRVHPHPFVQVRGGARFSLRPARVRVGVRVPRLGVALGLRVGLGVALFLLGVGVGLAPSCVADDVDA